MRNRIRTYDPKVTSLTGWMILANELFLRINFFSKLSIDRGNEALPLRFYGDLLKPCTCAPPMVTKYQKRISDPLLDRIDIHIGVPRVDYEKLSGDRMGGEDQRVDSQVVRAARNIQLTRFASIESSNIVANADMRVERYGSSASCRIKVRV